MSLKHKWLLPLFLAITTSKAAEQVTEYILDTVDGPVVKYLMPGSDDEHVRCISANKDPMFAEYEVQKSDILGIYRVVMCMKMMQNCSIF